MIYGINGSYAFANGLVVGGFAETDRTTGTFDSVLGEYGLVAGYRFDGFGSGIPMLISAEVSTSTYKENTDPTNSSHWYGLSITIPLGKTTAPVRPNFGFRGTSIEFVS
jgi:hypothetical protein